MKTPARQGKPSTDSVAQLHPGGTYSKVFDHRKRRVRGLWKRNDAFYAQLTIPTAEGKKVVRRVRLEDEEG